MGKITVKHYLNTEVQAEQSKVYSLDKDGKFVIDENQTLYPVYLQITVNRKTTKLKSTTCHSLTKNDFLKYKEKGTYYGEKQLNYYNTTHYLSNEIKQVESSLDYFYNKKKGNQNKVSIKNVVNFYMKDFDSSFFICYVNSETLFTVDHKDYEFIYDIIKKDANPIEVERFFKEQLHIDIYSMSKSRSNQDWGKTYKSVVLFFSLMPKDKNGRVIGKAINWFTGNLQETYRDKLKKNGFDVDLYFQPFKDLCELWEDLNMIQKFQFVQE